MLKKIILGVLFPLTFIYATDVTLLEQKASQGDALAAYKLATFYEEQKDTERSLTWYKKAASLALDVQRQNASLEKGILGEKIKRVERTQEAYSGFLVDYNDKETEDSVKQMLTKVFDIMPYQTNYVLPFTYDATSHEDKRHRSETKFQLSLQKTLLENFFGLNEAFMAGYTQTSWWQTSKYSTPFRETNYRPELFAIMPHIQKDSVLKAYQVGLLHESNGRSEPESRSWNRLYAKAFFQYEGLLMAPRVWYRIPEEHATDDNPDIDDYLGYGDVELIYPWKKQTFKLLVRNNLHFDDTNKGALQFDWTFPLWEHNLFGYLQLYSGYGESLIDYNKQNNKIGIGFALSR